jgi:hypothetical protein
VKRELHESHTWGPHEDGIRWVQCQECKVLLHEPEAELACDAAVVAAGRKVRAAEAAVILERVARREAGEMPGEAEPRGGYGLWQTLPPPGRRR